MMLRDPSHGRSLAPANRVGRYVIELSLGKPVALGAQYPRCPASFCKGGVMRPTAESTNRRSFLLKGAAVGAGTVGAGLLATMPRGLCERRPHQRRRGDSPLPGCGRDHRDRSVAAVQRARRHPGQRSPRRKREPGLHRGRRGAGRGHGPVHPRQHRRRDQPLHLHQRLPEGARRGNGQPGQVPHPAEQHRRPAPSRSDG